MPIFRRRRCHCQRRCYARYHDAPAACCRLRTCRLRLFTSYVMITPLPLIRFYATLLSRAAAALIYAMIFATLFFATPR